MATVNEVDALSAVSKFLSRRVIENREDEAADNADEVQALLESVAVTFLLYPQAALSFVMGAKNTLQQIVTADVGIVDYLLSAIDDIQNPSDAVNDISDLIEAQTALVEVDRLGRLGTEVRAYDRYTAAVTRFLDNTLAKSLKRRRTGGFERSGTEAKQDLFRILAAFGPAHQLVIARLATLRGGVSNFDSVDLTRIVSTKTVTRVRSSLRRVVRAVQGRTISNTATAIELLAGAAALESISNTRKIYDPTIKTGSFPKDRVIGLSSQPIKAVAVGAEGPYDFTGISTPWELEVAVDGAGGTTVTFPVAAGGDRVWVKAATGSATYNIPVGKNVLYVLFEGITPPSGEAAMIRAVSLPTGGAVTIAAILTALNNGGTGLVDGTAVQLSTTGRVLIYGSASVTKIVIKSVVPGTFDIDDNYVPATESVHGILGFSDEQTSNPVKVFTAADLADFLNIAIPSITASSVDNALVVQSNSTALLSSLLFEGTLLTELGLLTTLYEAQPTYLELVENGVAVSPESLGVFVGTHVSVADVASVIRSLSKKITAIEGTRLFFDGVLPRCASAVVTCTAPIVFDTQNLLVALTAFAESFDKDAREFQRVLSPLLSRPTLAQINDAKVVLQEVKTKLESLLQVLQAVVVRNDRREFDGAVAHIVSSLEERSLDRALDFLYNCQFAEFFNLTKEVASKSSRFLKAMGEVGRNDFSNITAEQDIEDLEPRASTPDDDLLPFEELSDPDDGAP